MDRIVLVGNALRKAVGDWTHTRVRRVTLAAYRAQGPRSCALLVLGDDALLELAPDVTLDGARCAGADVWIVAEDARPAVLAAWLQPAHSRFVAPLDFLDALEDVLNRLGRPRVPIEDLVDLPVSALSPEAAHMLDVLPRIRRPLAREWAAALRWSRHTLRRRCLRHFGTPSDDVVWRWVVVAVTRLRRDGRTVEQCAVGVGYSDASSLHRAFRIRGMEVPGVPASA